MRDTAQTALARITKLGSVAWGKPVETIDFI
jgi:hypothetical protein